MLRLGKGAQGLAIGQADAYFAGAIVGVHDLFDLAVQMIVIRAGQLRGARQLQPACFDQRHRRAADRQFQALGAVVGDLRVEGQAAG